MAIYREQLNELYYHAKMLVTLIEELNNSVDEVKQKDVDEAFALLEEEFNNNL